MRLAMMIFPNVTMQDFIGPYEVFSRVDKFTIDVFSPKSGEIKTDTGLTFNSSQSIDDVKGCDILFIPGGSGVNQLLEDSSLLTKIAQLGMRAQFVTSVCTGALVLAACGLLEGYRATTHWRYADLLPLCKAIPFEGRVVVDRNRITGGGVTAGIDFALHLVAAVVSEEMARQVQLQIEYNPAPPFDSGHPATAHISTVDSVRKQTETSHSRRRALVMAAYAALAKPQS